MDRNKAILQASRQVKEQYLKDLLHKIGSGEGATKKELAIIAKLETELASEINQTPTSTLIVSLKTVATFFGVTSRSVQLWTKEKGCPKQKHGYYNLKEVFDWWAENIGKTQDSAETENVKFEYWRWKTENERMKAEKTRESLIPRDDIANLWRTRMGEVSSGLQAFSYRLPPLLDGKTQMEMQSIIDEETWKLRDNYCRGGKFCPPEKGTT